jgi:hypothetical protein
MRLQMSNSNKELPLSLNTLNEGIHYELIPSDNIDDGWDVRLMEEYPETVIRFGTISLDNENEELKFSFEIVSTPDADLSLEDLTFTAYCGNILESVITESLSNGSTIMTDKDTGEQYVGEALREDYDEYKLTNNDSTESTN